MNTITLTSIICFAAGSLCPQQDIDPLLVSGALYRITQEDRNGGQTLSPVYKAIVPSAMG